MKLCSSSLQALLLCLSYCDPLLKSRYDPGSKLSPSTDEISVLILEIVNECALILKVQCVDLLPSSGGVAECSQLKASG